MDQSECLSTLTTLFLAEKKNSVQAEAKSKSSFLSSPILIILVAIYHMGDSFHCIPKANPLLYTYAQVRDQKSLEK